ncbi:hypothetical protein K8R03_00920 [Candidatus Kaiserbacteria bacterium]|nr:hypothetical protein [Candidatus Kaiserbacteria bacterium]
MDILHGEWPKIKAFMDGILGEWGIFALIVLATVSAFALGRLSALEARKPLISLTEAPKTASAAPILLGGSVIASRGGSTYYYPWCAGAAKIAVQNQRVFASIEDAKKAGLKPAKNCTGLQ